MDVMEQLANIGGARQRYERLEREAAEQLRPLVIAALQQGIRPHEIGELTGWSHAQIRNIARAAGLPPARSGRVKQTND